MKIVFCTQNMAPFRMRWMDEIAKYSTVVIYHLNEYESGLNKKYISFVPERATIKCCTKKLFGGGIGYSVSEILSESADLYLLDGYGFKGQQDLILKLRRNRVPFLMSVDGGFVREKENPFVRLIKKFFISRATAYLSTSDETDRYLNFYGGYGKIKYRHLFSNVMNSYIEERPATASEKEKLKNELNMKSEFSIIAVGKFEPRKGFDLLIEALKNKKRNVQLYFIGALKSEVYESYINEEIKEQIHFIDFCDQKTLKKYYRAADLLLLPTREDIWGLVISEGMANGIVTVTTEKCLAGVAMLEKSEIIPTENVEAIIEKIDYFSSLSEEERYEIGIRNIRKVKKYSIENATIADIEHFEDFLKQNYRGRKR